MKRKIIRQGGGGGGTIYLPKKWIDHKNLHPGDEIDITEVDDCLLLSAETKTTKKETTLKIHSNGETFIRTNLSDLYRLGYDKVKIIYENKDQADYVESAVENFLLGVEVTEKGKNYLILENVAEPSGEKQETLVRRMFLLIKESFELVHNDLISGKFSNLQQLKQLTYKVGQYNNFCRRNISKKKFTEEKIPFHWNMYVYLLLIQGNLLHLYQFLDKQKKLKMSKKNILIFNNLETEFNNLYHGFFKKDLNALEEVNDQARSLLYKDTYKQLEKVTGKESITIYYFGEMARLIYLITSPMLGILLE
jgi:hypothetical protein